LAREEEKESEEDEDDLKLQNMKNTQV